MTSIKLFDTFKTMEKKLIFFSLDENPSFETKFENEMFVTENLSLRILQGKKFFLLLS